MSGIVVVGSSSAETSLGTLCVLVSVLDAGGESIKSQVGSATGVVPLELFSANPEWPCAVYSWNCIV